MNYTVFLKFCCFRKKTGLENALCATKQRVRILRYRLKLRCLQKVWCQTIIMVQTVIWKSVVVNAVGEAAGLLEVSAGCLLYRLCSQSVNIL